MLFVINPILILWGIIIITGVLLFWSVLRFALSTCDADNTTQGLAYLFCLLLLSAGLAFAVMINNIPAN